MNIERRTTSNGTVEVRADEATNKITGLASPVYDNTPATEFILYDQTVERFAPDAFKHHLQKNPDVVALFNHSPDHVLGRTPNTLKLWQDARGLHYEISPPDTQTARDLITSIRRGDIRGSSFAFTPDDVEWQTEGERSIRLIKRAKLYDISPVTSPAYGGSNVSARTSNEQRQQLEQEKADYEARIETEKRLARIKQLTNR